MVYYAVDMSSTDPEVLRQMIEEVTAEIERSGADITRFLARVANLRENMAELQAVRGWLSKRRAVVLGEDPAELDDEEPPFESEPEETGTDSGRIAIYGTAGPRTRAVAPLI